MKITWSNKMGPRSRTAWALIVGPGDQVERFTGNSIPGKVAVLGSDFVKDGKWSHTTYRLQLAQGVRFLPGRMGWGTGTFVEGLSSATGKTTDRWPDVANALGVSLLAAQEFLREWFPETADKLDQIEADLGSLDEVSPVGAATINVSYGGPTRAARAKGYWEWPVRVLDEDDVEVGRVSATGEPSGNVKVLKRNKTSGHGGGYISLMLAVPEGCRAVHGPVPGEKTETEVAVEKMLYTAAEGWLQRYGRKAVHVATKEYGYGLARVLQYAERHGAPVPEEYTWRAADMWDFLAVAEELYLQRR